MKIGFIACEYNPFHNGHLYHIQKTKELGADKIICVMSGNFVQRGDFAIAEKHIRAKTALLNGADLVLELPLKYAISTASYFAQGFIEVISATKLDGFVSFGAKASLDELNTISDCINSPALQEYIVEMKKSGNNYPNAVSQYVKNELGEKGKSVLEDANNILGLEYISAIKKYNPKINYMLVERFGVMHNSNFSNKNIASASFIRDKLYNTTDCININVLLEGIKEFIPENCFETLKYCSSKGIILPKKEIFNAIALSRLTGFNNDYYLTINNVNQGIENRIVRAIKTCNSLDEVYNNVKSKNFTHSRIRQVILNAVLGVTKQDINNNLSYVRILGANKSGRELLYTISKNSELPFVSNLSQLNGLIECKRDMYLDEISGKLYNLTLPSPINGNPEFTIPPVYLD